VTWVRTHKFIICGGAFQRRELGNETIKHVGLELGTRGRRRGRRKETIQKFLQVYWANKERAHFVCKMREERCSAFRPQNKLTRGITPHMYRSSKHRGGREAFEGSKKVFEGSREVLEEGGVLMDGWQ
jgi:hypothetical protein